MKLDFQIKGDSLTTLGRFRDISQLVSEGEVISSDKFLSFAEKNESLVYFKRDLVFLGGMWRGRRNPSLINYPQTLDGKTLILGHSDKATPAFLSRTISKTKKVARIYGTNLEPVPGLSFSLPLGVTNFTNESKLHTIFGDVSHFISADKRVGFEEKFSLNLSASFTAKNNKRVRGKVLRVLSDLPSKFKVSVELPDFSAEGRIKFLESARRSTFTVCPEGNGVDTHRLWETLYMGGIPVVTPNPLMNSLYSRLPVLVVKNWSDLSKSNYLEERWHELNHKNWEPSLLKQSYWNTEVSR